MTSIPSRLRGLFLLSLMVLAAALAMIGCSAGARSSDVVSVTTEAITTTCSTDANCTGGTAPACGDVTTGICSAGICYYTMNQASLPTGCYCEEGDIQDCKTSGSMTYDGVQTCSVVTSSPLVTGWGACTSSSPFVGHTPIPVGNESIRKCLSTSVCDDADDHPVCADWGTTGVCKAPSAPKECIWFRAAEHGCACVQYDIRACTKAGGGAGLQMCDVTGSDPLNVDWGKATGWGTCT